MCYLNIDEWIVGNYCYLLLLACYIQHNIKSSKLQKLPCLSLLHLVVNTALLDNEIGSMLPLGLQKAVLGGIFAIGRAQLSESILNDSNPLGSSRLAKLRHIFEEGRSLQLQFPAEDLGFRYHCNYLFSSSCITQQIVTICDTPLAVSSISDFCAPF